MRESPAPRAVRALLVRSERLLDVGGDDRIQAEGEAGEVRHDGGMELSCDRSVDAAYISLIPPDGRTYGRGRCGVRLEEIADEARDRCAALPRARLRPGREGDRNRGQGARATLRESSLLAAAAECRVGARPAVPEGTGWGRRWQASARLRGAVDRGLTESARPCAWSRSSRWS